MTRRSDGNSGSPVSFLVWSLHLFSGLPLFRCPLKSWLCTCLTMIFLCIRQTCASHLRLLCLVTSVTYSGVKVFLLGSGGLMVTAPAYRSRGRWFDSTSTVLKLLAISFTPLCPCLSEETLKAVGPNSCVSSRLGCLEYNYLRLETLIVIFCLSAH